MKDFKLQLVEKMLIAGFEKRASLCEIDFLIETISGKSKKDFYLNSSLRISDEEKKVINDLVKKRIEENFPVQYLVNKAYFMNEEFFVDKNVLIPRPETEILVKEAENLIKQIFFLNKPFKIIDIGTGSGCIPIMIAKKMPSNIEIFASDISEKAIGVARKNATKHNVEHKINFIVSDIFSNINEKFDLIISNPPYIPVSIKKTLQKEVVMHEPPSALFASDEAGIEFYEKIIEQSKNKLNNGGAIIFELGINQSELVREILSENAFENIRVTKDLDNIERIISGQKK